ncbi:MAG: phosphate ABC transporter permease subunit PstC [Bacteroidetes bacterium]|nr:phosphate ABC transporter permease subunit PstC [Bacteroidota bacterium]
MDKKISHKPSDIAPDGFIRKILFFGIKKKNKNSLEKRFRLSEFLAEKIIAATSFVSFAFIILIFVFVFREALPIFSGYTDKQSVISDELEQETYGDIPSESSDEADRHEELHQSEEPVTIPDLLSTTWQPVSLKPKYGLVPLFMASLKVSLIAVLIAAPIAILAALFTAFFSSKWTKEILKPSIELLAGIPSVVVGFFALIVLATWIQDMFGLEYRLNAFVGGVALALSVIPIIYTISEDALSVVPKSYTEASLALGAAKWQTALFVVLPAATPGIFAAVLLGIGRAFGETMIVLMATGNAALFSLNPFEPVRTLSATIGAEMAEVIFGDTHYNVLFLIGALLFIITFALNAIAELFIRRRLMRKFGGK